MIKDKQNTGKTAVSTKINFYLKFVYVSNTAVIQWNVLCKNNFDNKKEEIRF